MEIPTATVSRVKEPHPQWLQEQEALDRQGNVPFGSHRAATQGARQAVRVAGVQHTGKQVRMSDKIQ